MDYLKNLVVLFHELCHALAAILTGGKVQYILVHGNEAGETAIVQNNYSLSFFFVISAGYIGSSFIGAILLNRGLSGKFEKESLFITGIFLFFMVYHFSFIGNLAYTIGIGWGVAFIFISLLSRFLASLCLIFIGTSVSLYSIYDLVDFARSIHQTDAGILAFYLTKVFSIDNVNLQSLGYIIAALWSFISIGIIYSIVKLTFQTSKENIDKNLQILQKQIMENKIKPDVVGWFLSRGIDLDGKPLPKDFITKIKKKRN